MTAAEQFHVSRISPSYWRVTFDNGPVNLLDPDTVDQLAELLETIENDPVLTVVVFRSDKPGYFMAHWDFLADNTRIAAMRPGPTGLHSYLDNFVRLSRLPVATIAEIRGRARGAGSEFVLATDIRERDPGSVRGRRRRGARRRADGAAGAPGRPRPRAGDPARRRRHPGRPAGRPEHRPFAELLFQNGLQTSDGIEAGLGAAIGELRQRQERNASR
jgi:Enoyl-CoA hydratase/isomerase